MLVEQLVSEGTIEALDVYGLAVEVVDQVERPEPPARKKGR
jgi:hypothetical protein